MKIKIEKLAEASNYRVDYIFKLLRKNRIYSTCYLTARDLKTLKNNIEPRTTKQKTLHLVIDNICNNRVTL